jgi:hypothetical protein
MKRQTQRATRSKVPHQSASPPKSRRYRKLSPRDAAAYARVLRAKGKMSHGMSFTRALRDAGTTARTARRFIGDLLHRDKSGHIRVMPSDQKRLRLNVVTDSGYTTVMAHGSKERRLAGEHLTTVRKVLRGQASESELDRFRGKTVGGQQLIFDPAQLRELGIILQVQPERELYADLDSGGTA